MTIHRRSDTSGFALLTRHRLSVVLVAVVLAAGCGGSASQRAAPVGPASIAQSPAMGEIAGTTSAAPAVPTVVPSDEPELLVVAAGDSIPFDDSGNGFVNRYAAALGTATGKTVGVRNLSQHTGLQVQDLLDELPEGPPAGRAKILSEADAIIVGIAHNDVPWNVDNDACDGADNEDWSKYTAACIAAEVKRLTPTYETVFERIAALRAGKPTVLRAINRYNDYIGSPSDPQSPEGVAASVAVVAAWNKMICGAAEANGFTCADISTKFNGEDGTEPSGSLLSGDYIHPSESGNKFIANVLTELGFEPLAP